MASFGSNLKPTVRFKQGDEFLDLHATDILCRARLLEHGNRDLPIDGRKVVQKLVQRLSSLEIVEQILHRYARTGEYGSPALNLRVDRDQVPLHDVPLDHDTVT